MNPSAAVVAIQDERELFQLDPPQQGLR